MAQASERLFLFAHLRAASGGWQGLSDRLSNLIADWPSARQIGIFMGLFGIRNHDVFVLLSLANLAEASPEFAACVVELRRRLPADIELIDSLPMKSTVRPSTDEPLDRAGVFVFRFFDVRNADVDEISTLSNAAWQTFERGDGYASEPIALFRSADLNSERCRMLLLTWYDNLTSWERSRKPHPDATANFRRRAALSTSVIAYATRLANTVAR